MSWNRSEKLALVGLVIALAGVFAAWLVVPEARRAFGLDVPQEAGVRTAVQNATSTKDASEATLPAAHDAAAMVRKKVDEPIAEPPAPAASTDTAPSAPGSERLASDPRCGSFPTPVLAQKTRPERRSVGGREVTDYNLTIVNRDDFPLAMFAAAPDLPPCGLNANSSRTWVSIYNAATDAPLYGFCAFKQPAELDLMWFAVGVGEETPASVYVTLEDRRCNKVYRSNAVVLEH